MTFRIEYWLTCDYDKDACNDTRWMDGYSVLSAKRYAIEQGWKFKRRNGREVAVCPRCQEKEN